MSGMEGLHVVVEHGVLAAVHVEEALRVADAEILEVQEAMRVVFPNELYESGLMCKWMP